MVGIILVTDSNCSRSRITSKSFVSCSCVGCWSAGIVGWSEIVAVCPVAGAWASTPAPPSKRPKVKRAAVFLTALFMSYPLLPIGCLFSPWLPLHRVGSQGLEPGLKQLALLRLAVHRL